jgi:hypothetical protein
MQAPVMLRLVFHDAATYDKHAGDGGADASVGFELDRPENKGLKRGYLPLHFFRFLDILIALAKSTDTKAFLRATFMTSCLALWPHEPMIVLIDYQHRSNFSMTGLKYIRTKRVSSSDYIYEQHVTK